MDELNPRLEKIKSISICPQSGGRLILESDKATCKKTGVVYPIRNGKIYFIEVPERGDELDDIKGKFKKWLGKYYYTLGRDIVAPTYPFNYSKWIHHYLNPTTDIVVDAGCGNHRVDENVICMDLFDYDAVDIVCNLDSLPFKRNSVDAFVTRSVLEHVPDPPTVIDGFFRCTRSNGIGMHLIPFLFPFHASPYDFQRFTHMGLKFLFEKWKIIEQFNVTGPITLAIINTIEFLSILLSFGSKKAKAVIYLILCLVLFPLKFLDAPFVRRKSFITIAPTILTVIRKP